MHKFSLSGLSVLMALALALWEWVFFFRPAGFEWAVPSPLGLDLPWIIFIYLSFQLISIPFAVGAARDRFIGVIDGMASLVPLGLTLVVIFGSSELLDTSERWGAAFLLLCVTAADLFGGYAINIALSRRMMDVAGPAPA